MPSNFISPLSLSLSLSNVIITQEVLQNTFVFIYVFGKTN